ncbi:flagellar filament capping protein FliD [Cohnella boryungensis]|uniref:Flagellar hook-associated protein 2 n=1 Tax=Cohnella boryungensis TaxID=768479 RepID=A0ABV8S8T0_9BACL
MVTRITGMASGLDVDQLVKDLMKAKRAPLDKLTVQKTTLEWQREQYREINAKIVDFRNNKLFNYGLEGTFNAKQATISGNSSAVSATAKADAVTGSMTIEVTKLAEGATWKSASGAGMGAVDLNTKLKDLGGSFNYTADAEGKITIQTGGSSIVLDENTDTLATLVSKLNNSKDANVNVFLDSRTGEMSITSKTTGDASAINLVSDIFDNFGLVQAAGHDAELKINGISTKRASNTFTENGVEITLNGLSQGNSTTLKVGSNTNQMIDTIKSFVKDYNELMDAINKKLGEERYRTYKPLTSEQKKEMSESEVELWESKAKSGLLKRDSTFTTLVSSFRLSAVTDVNVNGTNVNLSSLGISTGEYQQRGKLIIDETKLRSALEANPDQVIGFFTQRASESEKTPPGASAVNKDNGLFGRLSNIAMFSIQDLATKAGTSRVSTTTDAAFNADSNIGEQLRLLDIRMTDMNKRMLQAENQYYKQFAAMESAINRFSAQSASLFNKS